MKSKKIIWLSKTVFVLIKSEPSLGLVLKSCWLYFNLITSKSIWLWWAVSKCIVFVFPYGVLCPIQIFPLTTQMFLLHLSTSICFLFCPRIRNDDELSVCVGIGPPCWYCLSLPPPPPRPADSRQHTGSFQKYTFEIQLKSLYESCHQKVAK